MMSVVFQQVDEAEEEALEAFLSHDKRPQRTLADIIRERVTVNETEACTQYTGDEVCGVAPLCDIIMHELVCGAADCHDFLSKLGL